MSQNASFNHMQSMAVWTKVNSPSTAVVLGFHVSECVLHLICKENDNTWTMAEDDDNQEFSFVKIIEDYLLCRR